MKELRILTTILPNGKRLKPVARYTRKSASHYANAMHRKYGDGVMVEEWNTVTEQRVTWGV